MSPTAFVLPSISAPAISGPKRAPPPGPISLPAKTSFVFTHRRMSSSSSVHDVPPSSSVLLHGQHYQNPNPPLRSPSSSRPTLSESQLMRHGAGAHDLRSAMVHARTPAGFVPLQQTGPCSPHLQSDPPSFDPNINPFFPPVLFLNSRVPQTPYGVLCSAEPKASSSSSCPLAPSPPCATAVATHEYDSTSYFSPHPQPSMYATSPESIRSSGSATSTLVSSTPMSVNAEKGGKTSSSSSMSSSWSSRPQLPKRLSSQQGLSLTELLYGDWASPPAPIKLSSSTSSKRRPQSSIKENC
jgi:hypothetical protein